jgi:hypothetical protein
MALPIPVDSPAKVVSSIANDRLISIILPGPPHNEFLQVKILLLFSVQGIFSHNSIRKI